MENNTYNDNQIMSPNLMEQIAKKYNEQISKEACPINYDIKNEKEYTALSKTITSIYENARHIKAVNNLRHLQEKETNINYILFSLAKLKQFFNCNYISDNKKTYGYMAIINCLSPTAKAISLSISLLNKIPRETKQKEQMHEIVSTLINLLNCFCELLS